MPKTPDTVGVIVSWLFITTFAVFIVWVARDSARSVKPGRESDGQPAGDRHWDELLA